MARNLSFLILLFMIFLTGCGANQMTITLRDGEASTTVRYKKPEEIAVISSLEETIFDQFYKKSQIADIMDRLDGFHYVKINNFDTTKTLEMVSVSLDRQVHFYLDREGTIYHEYEDDWYRSTSKLQMIAFMKLIGDLRN